MTADTQKKKSAKRHIPSPTSGLCALAALLLLVASILLIYFEMNRVGSYRIQSGKFADKASVQKIVGNPEGDFLPAMNTSSMCKQIKALSPMVADVRFELSFTRRLTVRVIDEVYAYYYRAEDGRTLLLNPHFKVLGVHDKTAYEEGLCHYDLSSLTELYITPETESIVIGEILPFKHMDKLSGFVRELSHAKGTLYDTLNLLDLRNDHNIIFIFDNLARVVLPEYTDFDLKCRAILKMMEKNGTRENECPTRFTYVDPANAAVHWAVWEWYDLYQGYSR